MIQQPPASSRPVIVVGVDGSASSAEALRWAFRQARLTGAYLRAVTCWHMPTSAYGPVPYPDGVDFRGDAERVLDESVATVSGDGTAGVDVQKVVVEGPPARELLNAAEGADLLVVGSRGHGAFVGMVLGSVSAYCVAHAWCPVVVVHHGRPAGEETREAATAGAHG